MNPFDNDDLEFVALKNEEGQYSLWPTFAEVPAGWRVSFGPASRMACLEHIDDVWDDITPLSARQNAQ